jgi:hypothetical protein
LRGTVAITATLLLWRAVPRLAQTDATPHAPRGRQSGAELEPCATDLKARAAKARLRRCPSTSIALLWSEKSNGENGLAAIRHEALDRKALDAL